VERLEETEKRTHKKLNKIIGQLRDSTSLILAIVNPEVEEDHSNESSTVESPSVANEAVSLTSTNNLPL